MDEVLMRYWPETCRVSRLCSCEERVSASITRNKRVKMEDMKEKYRFSAGKLIRYLGGQRAVAGLHEKHFKGLYDFLPENTVRSWVRNTSIPSFRLAELVHLGEIIGLPVDRHHFVEVTARRGSK